MEAVRNALSTVTVLATCIVVSLMVPEAAVNEGLDIVPSVLDHSILSHTQILPLVDKCPETVRIEVPIEKIVKVPVEKIVTVYQCDNPEKPVEPVKPIETPVVVTPVVTKPAKKLPAWIEDLTNSYNDLRKDPQVRAGVDVGAIILLFAVFYLWSKSGSSTVRTTDTELAKQAPEPKVAPVAQPNVPVSQPVVEQAIQGAVPPAIKVEVPKATQEAPIVEKTEVEVQRMADELAKSTSQLQQANATPDQPQPKPVQVTVLKSEPVVVEKIESPIGITHPVPKGAVITYNAGGNLIKYGTVVEVRPTEYVIQQSTTPVAYSAVTNFQINQQ